MRRLTRAGRTTAVLLLLLAMPGVAHATTGGATITAPVESAEQVSAAADAVQSRPLTITRSQLRSVQRRVRVRADGVLGARTRAAIKRYQRSKGLKAHGRPDVATLRALGLKIADTYEARLIAQASSVRGPLPATLAESTGAVEAARSRIGDRYVYGGSRPGGFDCSGLTVWAFAAAGIKLPRTSFQQYRVGVAVPKDQIQPGDLVFFDSAGPGASHVGVATSPTRVISSTNSGVMEHAIATGYWGARYVGARRVTR